MYSHTAQTGLLNLSKIEKEICTLRAFIIVILSSQWQTA